MNAVTQCPECGTRFKVSQAQLDMHQGMVRCGRCQAIFNATKPLHYNELSPQLTLTLAQEEIQQVPVESQVEHISATHDQYDFSHLATASSEEALETSPNIIAAGCPFCMTMLSDGVKMKDQSEHVQVLDIAEITARANGL